MHDIDRTQLEFMPESGAFEAEQFGYGESQMSGESWMSEADEMELASELLAVTNEAELDQFLGSLLSKAKSAIGSVIRSPVGQAIGGVLKSAAKKALPLAGGALGGWIGGPLGAKIGSGLASAAGKAIGLEAESMSNEDQEFEGARQFVRMAANTVQRAAAAPATTNPVAAAQAAVTAAARQFAPGLLGPMPAAANGAATQVRGQSGRWTRKGNRIVIHGV